MNNIYHVITFICTTSIIVYIFYSNILYKLYSTSARYTEESMETQYKRMYVKMTIRLP